MAFTRDLADYAAAYLPGAREYVAASAAIDVTRNRAAQRVERILEDFQKLHPTERGTGAGTVNAFMRESVLEGKWGFDTRHMKADPEMAAKFAQLSDAAQQVVRAGSPARVGG